MTPDGIAAEFWANFYADKFYAGRPEEIEDEDEDFDLEAVLRQNEADAEDEDDDDVSDPLPADFEEVR